MRTTSRVEGEGQGQISPHGDFSLYVQDGDKGHPFVNWTPADFNPTEVIPISVTVENHDIRMYVGSKLVGAYRDTAYVGGTHGLVVETWGANSSSVVVSDFDNVVLRRKPS